MRAMTAIDIGDITRPRETAVLTFESLNMGFAVAVFPLNHKLAPISHDNGYSPALAGKIDRYLECTPPLHTMSSTLETFFGD